MALTILSNNIKKLRECNSLTQDELGHKLRVSGKTVSSWENGRSEPKMGKIKEMARLFDCSISDILDDINVPTEDANSMMSFAIKQISMVDNRFNLEKLSEDDIDITVQKIIDYSIYLISQKK